MTVDSEFTPELLLETLQKVLTMGDFVSVELEDKCEAHLNALYSKDEFRHQRWDVRLIEDGVRDTLQQRLHWGHTMHDHTPAQKTVVEKQKHNTWTHLKHICSDIHIIYDNCRMYINLLNHLNESACSDCYNKVVNCC